MPAQNLRRFSSITKVELVYENQDGQLTAFFDDTRNSLLMQDRALREELRNRAASEAGPCMLKDEYNVCYAALQYRSGWLYIGPMSGEKLSPARRAQYYRSHGIPGDDVRALRAFTPREILDIVMLLASVTQGVALDAEEWLHKKGLAPDAQRSQEKDRLDFVLSEEEENDDGAWRHSYHEEQLLMQAVREGRTRDAVRIAENMDADAGRLSAQEHGHWRNLAIVNITLLARAAIEAGLSPAVAYRLSGYYIRKCDLLHDQAQILHLRNRAIEEMTARVNEKRRHIRTSGYVESCKDYIARHYREKIYLDTIADSLGISSAYLSKLFRKETGVCLQDYVNQVRVERAANLLIYSDKSLPAIAQYVHFPNQSYFGKMFKRFQNMTPREFRDRHKPREFREERPPRR